MGNAINEANEENGYDWGDILYEFDPFYLHHPPIPPDIPPDVPDEVLFPPYPGSPPPGWPEPPDPYMPPPSVPLPQCTPPPSMCAP